MEQIDSKPERSGVEGSFKIANAVKMIDIIKGIKEMSKRTS